MLPTRKNLRLRDYDYTNAGAYFVTICTHQKQKIFGEIKSDVVGLNTYGELVEQIWQEMPTHFSVIHLDAFIVMPNHVHGIVFIDSERARHASPLQPGPKLGTVIGAFESATARLINQMRATPGAPLWQRNYYEHVIRNEVSLLEIREYIASNPLKWTLDEYYV